MRILAIGVLLTSTMTIGCRPAPEVQKPVQVQQEVREFAEQISHDLAREGPRAWLRQFYRGPAFFMASEGRLVFPSNDSADVYVSDLATRLRAIELHWQHLRIDSLTPDLALIGTPFTESLTDTAGHTQRIAGYFTAVAQRTGGSWQLRNAHWSLSPAAGKPGTASR